LKREQYFTVYILLQLNQIKKDVREREGRVRLTTVFIPVFLHLYLVLDT